MEKILNTPIKWSQVPKKYKYVTLEYIFADGIIDAYFITAHEEEPSVDLSPDRQVCWFSPLKTMLLEKIEKSNTQRVERLLKDLNVRSHSEISFLNCVWERKKI
jgi:hypothetical protein